MAWLLLIFVLQVVGIVLFLLLGGTAVGKKRHRKQAEVSARIKERTASLPERITDCVGPDYVQSVVTLNRSLGSVPAIAGNARIRKVEDDYRVRSRELTLEEWGRRPAGARYLDNVMRLTATLQ